MDQIHKQIEEDILNNTVEDILIELKKAKRKFQPFNSLHEGYAVLKEEVDELWDEIKKHKTGKGGYVPKIEKECIQVAAMAIRFICELT